MSCLPLGLNQIEIQRAARKYLETETETLGSEKLSALATAFQHNGLVIMADREISLPLEILHFLSLIHISFDNEHSLSVQILFPPYANQLGLILQPVKIKMARRQASVSMLMHQGRCV